MKELDYGAYRTETFRNHVLQVSPIKGAGGRLRSGGRGRRGRLLVALAEPDAERLPGQLLDEPHRSARPENGR